MAIVLTVKTRKYNQLHCCLPLFIWQLVSLLSNMAFRNASSARRLSGAPVLMILTLALLATKSTAPSLWLAGRLTDQNNVELQPFIPNQSEISSPLFNVNLLSLTPNGCFLLHLHACNPSSCTNAGILMLASSMWWYSGKSWADRQRTLAWDAPSPLPKLIALWNVRNVARRFVSSVQI